MSSFDHLTPLQRAVLREGQTEPGGSGAYLYHWQEGTYLCAGCRSRLFESAQKYDSGTGWPSFFAGLEPQLGYRDDPICGMHRLEVICGACDGHLGHVFDDDESPTGRRFCINSASLEFSPGQGAAGEAARVDDSRPQ